MSNRRRIPILLHGPGCKLGNGRGCPLVVHSWADLQLVHGFHCYDNTAPNAKCQQVLVLSPCLVIIIISFSHSIFCSLYSFCLLLCYTQKWPCKYMWELLPQQLIMNGVNSTRDRRVESANTEAHCCRVFISFTNKWY